MNRLWIAGFCAALLTVTTGCSDKKEEAAPITTETTARTTTTNPIGLPPPVKVTPVATLESPTAVAQRDGDDAFYVTEKAGRVRSVRNGAIGAVPVLDMSEDLSDDGERGLLGIAFAAGTQKFYVYYTDKTGTIHITEFVLGANDVVDMNTRRDLLTIPHPRTNHNGGQLTFGPDGHLYIGVGDGGGGNDPDKNGQNLTVLLGKILRIDPTPQPRLPYTIPYDNPFVKQTGARGEIWAYGLRNPWRFSFDKSEGGIWIGDVGQGAWEEIDHVQRDAKGGQNYGWPLREGSHRLQGEKPADAVDPLYEYDHSDGACSVTGGYVYRGAAIPELTGRYVYGDYCNGKLSVLTKKGTSWTSESLHLNVPNLASFAQDRNGELYVLSTNGTFGRIDAA